LKKPISPLTAHVEIVPPWPAIGDDTHTEIVGLSAGDRPQHGRPDRRPAITHNKNAAIVGLSAGDHPQHGIAKHTALVMVMAETNEVVGKGEMGEGTEKRGGRGGTGNRRKGAGKGRALVDLENGGREGGLAVPESFENQR
jgi:hypothetical protein